ncbi:hypothetical protein DFS33DRAFT_1328786 [Desarmillaria ectypa]|nr:hypothetical protein DFS33DRAFT_1328786 [Desarmillaria ectypa]
MNILFEATGPKRDVQKTASYLYHMPCPPSPRKHKPSRSTAPYKQKLGPKGWRNNNVKTHRMTAVNLDARDRREILTLGDWMEIVDFYDNNQPMKQCEVVEHFTNYCTGLQESRD